MKLIIFMKFRRLSYAAVSFYYLILKKILSDRKPFIQPTIYLRIFFLADYTEVSRVIRYRKFLRRLNLKQLLRINYRIFRLYESDLSEILILN